MRFVYPEILWCLGFIPVLIGMLILTERRRRARLLSFTGEGGTDRLLRHIDPWGDLRRAFLAVLATILLIIAAARPQVPAGKIPIVRSGRDVAIVLDVSTSMLARDLPSGRLAYARRVLKSCLDRMSGDRVGLVAFAGEAYVQCPLTLDRTALYIFLDALSTDVVGQPGTALAAALRKGIEVVGDREDRTRVIFLLSDAEDHQGEIEETLAELRNTGVRIVAVGMGSPEGEPIPIPGNEGGTEHKRDTEGRIVMTRLNEGLLGRFAKETGGFYVRATGSGAEVDVLMNYIDSLEEGEVEGGIRIIYRDRYGELVVPALILLVLRILLGIRRRPKRKRPKKEDPKRKPNGRERRMKRVATASLMLLFLATFASLAEESQTNDPLKLYEEGRMEEARDRLHELQQESPKDPRIPFDLGNVAYRAQDYPVAVTQFEGAALLAEGDRIVAARSLYNRGCALFRAEDMEGAIESFRSGLLLDPEDEDAKVNLEYLLRNMEQQQQENQSDSCDDSKESQDGAPPDSSSQGEKQQDPGDQENRQQQQPESEEENEEDPRQQNQPQDEESEEEPDENPQPQTPDEEESGEQQMESQPAPSEMLQADIERLLESLALSEKTIQAERMKVRLKKVSTEKDW